MFFAHELMLRGIVNKVSMRATAPRASQLSIGTTPKIRFRSSRLRSKIPALQNCGSQPTSSQYVSDHLI